jgi:hypothetical protein
MEYGESVRAIYRILVAFLHEKITELVLHRIGLQAVHTKAFQSALHLLAINMYNFFINFKIYILLKKLFMENKLPCILNRMFHLSLEINVHAVDKRLLL